MSKSPRRTSKSPQKGRLNAPAAAVSELISKLFHSREQAHILHLQTSSYAKHKALNAYYDAIVGLADKYAETYQGTVNEVIKGYKSDNFVEGDKAIIPYFRKLEKDVKAMKPRLPKTLDLENTYAEILDLIHSTLYMLVRLN